MSATLAIGTACAAVSQALQATASWWYVYFELVPAARCAVAAAAGRSSRPCTIQDSHIQAYRAGERLGVGYIYAYIRINAGHLQGVYTQDLAEQKHMLALIIQRHMLCK